MEQGQAYIVNIKSPRVRTDSNCLDILRLTNRTTRAMRVNDFYKELKKQYPNLRKYNSSQICAYIKRFNELLAQVTIDEKDGVLLPMKTGHMMIGTREKTDSIDKALSTELGRVVYHTNDSSYGYWYKVYWTAYGYNQSNSTPTPMFENSKLWAFAPCTNYTKSVAKVYKENWKKYRVLGKNRQLRNFEDTHKYRPVRAIHNNEFEF